MWSSDWSNCRIKYWLDIQFISMQANLYPGTENKAWWSDSNCLHLLLKCLGLVQLIKSPALNSLPIKLIEFPLKGWIILPSRQDVICSWFSPVPCGGERRLEVGGIQPWSVVSLGLNLCNGLIWSIVYWKSSRCWPVRREPQQQYLNLVLGLENLKPPPSPSY